MKTANVKEMYDNVIQDWLVAALNTYIHAKNFQCTNQATQAH